MSEIETEPLPIEVHCMQKKKKKKKKKKEVV